MGESRNSYSKTDPDATFMEDCFICVRGRKLSLRRECTELKHGQFVTTAWYRCEDCGGCPKRNACCQARDTEKPKEVMLRKTFWELRDKSQENMATGTRDLFEDVPVHSG